MNGVLEEMPVPETELEAEAVVLWVTEEMDRDRLRLLQDLAVVVEEEEIMPLGQML